MRGPPLLSTIGLTLLLASMAAPGRDVALGASTTVSKLPASSVSGAKAPPAPPVTEAAPPADEPPVIEGVDPSEGTGETATTEETPAEVETTLEGEAPVAAEADPADETAAESDGAPADATMAEDAPATAAPPASSGPAPAMPPVTARERPSLLHRTPPPIGTPPPPPPKAEALPRPPRPMPDERRPSPPMGTAGSTAPTASSGDIVGAPRAATVAVGDRGLPSLASLTATRERPLFVAGRRGPDQRGSAVVKMEPVTPDEEIEPQNAPFSAVLGGVVSGPGIGLAILVDPSTNAVSRVKRGEDHDGWTLAELDRLTATFRRGEERAVLKLKPPGSTVVPGGGVSDDAPPRPAGRKPGPHPRTGTPPEEEPQEE